MDLTLSEVPVQYLLAPGVPPFVVNPDSDLLFDHSSTIICISSNALFTFKTAQNKCEVMPRNFGAETLQELPVVSASNAVATAMLMELFTPEAHYMYFCLQ